MPDVPEIFQRGLSACEVKISKFFIDIKVKISYIAPF